MLKCIFVFSTLLTCSLIFDIQKSNQHSDKRKFTLQASQLQTPKCIPEALFPQIRQNGSSRGSEDGTYFSRFRFRLLTFSRLLFSIGAFSALTTSIVFPCFYNQKLEMRIFTKCLEYTLNSTICQKENGVFHIYVTVVRFLQTN